MEPITRKEMYLAAAAGQDVALPEPITREEKFLYKIAMRGGTGVSSWNDLTDKPFYDERTEILPETQMVYIEDSELFATEFTQTFVEGNTYIVNWNGTEYTCVAFAADMDGDGDGVNESVVVGNPAVFGGEFSDVPFTLLAGEGMLGAMALDGSTEVTLSIVLRNLQTLDAKYIPTIPEEKLPTIPEEKLPTIQVFDLVEMGLTLPAAEGLDNSTRVEADDVADYKDFFKKILRAALRGPVIFMLPTGVYIQQHEMKTATTFDIRADGTFLNATFSWKTFIVDSGVTIRTYNLAIFSNQIVFYYEDKHFG